MRRLLLVVVAPGLTLTLTVGFIGAAAASSKVKHVKPGTSLQLYSNGQTFACEQQTFKAHHKWITSTQTGSDAGTYTGGGGTIDETWTAGPNTTSFFHGVWNGSYYAGTYLGPTPGDSQAGTLGAPVRHCGT